MADAAICPSCKGMENTRRFSERGHDLHVCRQYGMRLLRHQRIPFADECFIPARWQSPGGSTLRNVAKRLVAGTPFALPLLAKLYERRHGGKIFSSFIILTK